MATFNIGQQNAANIQNIGGDAVIHGSVHASASWEVVELRRTIARAMDEVAELGLSPDVLQPVNQALDLAAEEAAKPKPDKHDVAQHLGTATRTLQEAGALVDAGPKVTQTLRRAVSLLGPVGLAVVGAI